MRDKRWRLLSATMLGLCTVTGAFSFRGGLPVGRCTLGCRRRLVIRASAERSAGEEEGRKRVVFLGTPDVAARTLELLLQASKAQRGGGFDVGMVVTNPPAPAGRKLKLTPSPVQTLAESVGVPILTPEKARDAGFLDALKSYSPDLCITAAYGQFLPQAFLNIPRYGTLNIHPSLLPKYRGASPVQRTLQSGDRETGVSVLFTVLKMDAGPILRQVPYTLNGNEKAPELLMKLFEAGTEALVDALPSVWDRSARPTPQDDAEASKADKVSSSEAACDFATESASTIHNKVRAFAGWPGTRSLFEIEGEEGEPIRLKIITTQLVGSAAAAAAQATDKDVNRVELVGKALRVTCADGSVLDMLEVQAPTKKAMDARSFANGLRGRKLRWRALATVAPPAA